MDIDWRSVLPHTFVISNKEAYRGYIIYDTGRGVKIIVNRREMTFPNVQTAQAYIDAALAGIVKQEA